MFIGGLALAGMGAQQISEAPEKGQAELNKKNRTYTPYMICTSNPQYYTEEGCRNDIELAKKADWHEKNVWVEDQQNEGTTKAFFGCILMLFAFLLMWGGNRTRRPKEVRIKRD